MGIIVVQTGSTTLPTIKNSRDIDFILVCDSNIERSEAMKKDWFPFSMLKRNGLYYTFEYLENLISVSCQPLYRYEFAYMKVIYSNSDKYNQLFSEIMNCNIISEGEQFLYYFRDCIEPHLEYMITKKMKGLYHVFNNMYIIKNQSYYNFTEHQKEIVNLAHQRQEIPEKDIQELRDFILSLPKTLQISNFMI